MSSHPFAKVMLLELQMYIFEMSPSRSVQFTAKVTSCPICVGGDMEESVEIVFIDGTALVVWSIVICGLRVMSSV